MVSILYTGGTGRMGSVIREALAGRYEEVRLYTRSEPTQLYPNEKVYRGDLSEIDAMVNAFQGVDVVVHFGGIADERSFDEILKSNIKGTFNVFEAARLAEVRRVVYASSNHAIGFYKTSTTIDEVNRVRPDTFYGVSKVFGEALGSLYHDKWLLEVVCLRIGSFRDKPEDIRQLSTWLSYPDGAELIRCSIDAADIGFEIVYGCSNNDRKWWDISRGATRVGFIPQDNAEHFAGRFVNDESEVQFHGGGYTDPNYRGGLW